MPQPMAAALLTHEAVMALAGQPKLRPPRYTPAVRYGDLSQAAMAVRLGVPQVSKAKPTP